MCSLTANLSYLFASKWIKLYSIAQITCIQIKKSIVATILSALYVACLPHLKLFIGKYVYHRLFKLRVKQ